MSITLSLTGHADLTPHRLTRAEAREWLEKAAVWFEGTGDAVLDARVVRDAEDKPLLWVLLHPASPPAEVRLGASGRVRVNATTAPAGPGYHIHLCELLCHFAADFDLTWDVTQTQDSTNFFQTGDLLACESRFLQCLADECASGADPRAVGLRTDHGFTFPAEVLTPIGPRTNSWRKAIAADPTCGRDSFPWWEPELDAAFYRGRALTRLWCDFPWRIPLNESEGEMADQIANDLAAAFKLDATMTLPWNEWLEVLAAIENDQEGFTVTPKDPVLSMELSKRMWNEESQSRKQVVGYRRYPIRVQLTAGWSIFVPGDFAQEWDDERTWTGWNLSRTVWFHALGFTKPDGGRPSAEEALDVGRKSLPEGESIGGICRDDLRGEAVFGPADEDGRTVWRLSGVAAVPGQLAVCNVYSEAAGDRGWAEMTWQSLRHSAAAE